MLPWKKTPATCGRWLADFARRLAWTFPEPQAKEILADYQDQFRAGAERGRSDDETIEAVGTPAEAVAQVLEEDPGVRKEMFRSTLLWGAVLAVCWAFLWVCFSGMSEILFWGGSCAFLPMGASALFMLVRGPARVNLEAQATQEKRRAPLLTFIVPAVLMLVCVVAEEVMILVVVRLGYRSPGWHSSDIGVKNTWFLMIFMWIAGALAVLLLILSVTRSMRYFPGVIHAVAALGTGLFFMTYYTDTDVDAIGVIEVDVLLRAIPYVVGLLTALTFQKWIDGRKPMPQCFQTKAAAWTDWHHRLGVNLIGWFPPEQTVEILSDYQEQYELGRESGKSEAEIINEFGRPDSVTHELLKEDRKARLGRRKAWLWIALLAFACWCLFRLMLSYNYGTIFVHVLNPTPEAVGFLVPGTLALFMLLHGKGRAAVESQFPCEKRPTIWLFAVPAIAVYAVVGWAVFALLNIDAEVLGRPAHWILADLIELSTLATILLAIWALARCFSGSILYFPAVIHSAGCVAAMLAAGMVFQSMDVDYIFADPVEQRLSPDVLRALIPAPYFLGLLLAILSWAVLRSAGKRGK